MKLLEEKYGASKNQGLLDSIGDTSRISHGSRYVLTKVSGFVDTSIDLRYYDRELEKAAEKERIAIEQGKVDPTGL